MAGNRTVNLGFLVSPRMLVAFSIFLAASYQQNECHGYLAGLKKYSLPEAGLFRYLVCPHYTCECLIYLALAVAGAPPGQIFNRTLLCATLFVAVNLGATAIGTQEWYRQKFGSERLASRHRMIPFLF